MRAFSSTSLVKQYDRGDVTEMELLTRLAQEAVHTPPGQMVADLPDWLVQKLREESSSPPTDRDKIRVFSIAMWPRETQQETVDARFRDETRRYVDGLWRWHNYFRSQDGSATP